MVKHTKRYNKSKKQKRKTKKMTGSDNIFHVQEPWFSHIKEGRKTVEGRLNKGRFSNLREGDIVTWMNNDNNINRMFKTKIVYIKKYNTFSRMIEVEGLETVLPGIKTIDKGVKNIYRKFYSEEKEDKYGVLAIKVEPLE
jgi:ASC-1-like (ASCH) protein